MTKGNRSVKQFEGPHVMAVQESEESHISVVDMPARFTPIGVILFKCGLAGIVDLEVRALEMERRATCDPCVKAHYGATAA
jgi:hypothetical protein